MNDLKRTSSFRKAMTVGQSKVVLAAACVAALFCAVGLFHTATRVAVVKAGYALGKVQKANSELVREQEHLKMERATLRSAPRLESFARARLGMVPPSATQLVVIRPRPQGPATGQRVAAVLPPAKKTATP